MVAIPKQKTALHFLALTQKRNGRGWKPFEFIQRAREFEANVLWGI